MIQGASNPGSLTPELVLIATVLLTGKQKNLDFHYYL